MNAQVFTSRGLWLTPSRFACVTNSLPRPHKANGGLWTSSYCREIGSDWLRWAYTERHLYTDDDKPGLWLLTPKPDANVYTIDSEDDLQRLLAEYEVPDHPFKDIVVRMFSLIDFEAMAKDYDAIHLTEQGQWKTRWSTPGLYGWDVECTYWLRWAFDEVQPLPWQDEWERK